MPQLQNPVNIKDEILKIFFLSRPLSQPKVLFVSEVQATCEGCVQRGALIMDAQDASPPRAKQRR
jgi:hypothetical protein